MMKFEYSIYLYMRFFPSLSFNKALKKQIPLVQGWLNTSTQLAKLHAPSVGTAIIP